MVLIYNLHQMYKRGKYREKIRTMDSAPKNLRKIMLAIQLYVLYPKIMLLFLPGNSWKKEMLILHINVYPE